MLRFNRWAVLLVLLAREGGRAQDLTVYDDVLQNGFLFSSSPGTGAGSRP